MVDKKLLQVEAERNTSCVQTYRRKKGISIRQAMLTTAFSSNKKYTFTYVNFLVKNATSQQENDIV